MYMNAMVMEKPGQPLVHRSLPVPQPGPGEVLIRVKACGVCRTDLHIVDNELDQPKLPLIPGHEIVGVVAKTGEAVTELATGDRVGVGWLGHTCQNCDFCRQNHENLCAAARFTGYQIDGGYAEYSVAEARYCFPIPDCYSDTEAAPLLCAGLIGFRTLRLAGPCETVGIYGFGAAAHIVAQIARYEGKRVYAFTRPGDRIAQDFAMSLGAEWAGDSSQTPPVELDSALIFAPAGELVPVALSRLRKGGTVVCGGIHMSDIPSFSYDLLWHERSVCSVANLTRRDGRDFFQIAPRVPVRTSVTPYSLQEANAALADLRAGNLSGAAVLNI
ncbi:MAG: zinc-dependent alcohol dehydrogenase family protein [Chromatiales bacterium]|jgi:propanol-preferring alcohol dehydrogenase|nr:zinc-dependent alcohol dehydrogenase family protein [Chromatiales bacterium]MDH4014592.1 zinc-dependent alcohol dehydrogenase family protein [Chromatiales bacterium]